MSLSSMLSGKSSEDKEFQEIIFKALPKKSDFKTLSGKTAFKDYTTLVPYGLNNSGEASLVGCAFDYLARAMIAQIIEKGKEASIFELKALSGLHRLQKILDPQDYKILQQKFSQHLCDYINYVYSDWSPLPKNLVDKCCQEELHAWSSYVTNCNFSKFHIIEDINELIPGAYYFAKLEQVYRSGRIAQANDLLAEPSETIVSELIKMCNAFKNTFIEKDLVHTTSLVIFNPMFGIGSLACGGADADIYIDGVLYDFKSTKTIGYNKLDVAQLSMYYYLNIIASYAEHCKIPATLKDYNILKIAFYKARFGEIEYCDTTFFDTDTSAQTFEKLSDHLNKRLTRYTLPKTDQ